MDGEFPLWRLRPEDAARIIILDSEPEPKRLAMEHKREMRIRPSHRSKPSSQDMRALAKAKDDNYWKFYFLEENEQFPRIGILQGPLLRDGTFVAYRDTIEHPLGAERPRDKQPFEIYSRKAYDRDIAALEKSRALLMENFVLGQRGEGPYLDGVIYKKADDLLLAEIARCTNKYRAMVAIMQARRFEKAKAAAQVKPKEKWFNIGADEKIALTYKHSGFTVRRVDVSKPYYEVLMK